MSKVTMPEPVATAYETETGVPRFTPTTYGAAIIKTGDEIITTTQAEAYADARVRETLRKVLSVTRWFEASECSGVVRQIQDEIRTLISKEKE